MRKYDRREFLLTAVIGTSAFPFARNGYGRALPDGRELRLYVGTYTSGTESKGIFHCTFDPATGKLGPPITAAVTPDPSFLTVDRSGRFLFAVNELVEFEGKPSGSVTSFAIDKRTGSLTEINRQPTQGGAPCHISITRRGRFLLVANYVGGNISVLPFSRDGEIGPATFIAKHTGSGPNKDRQQSAHAHSITLDNNGQFAVAADLGIDKVMVYKLDRSRGVLIPNPLQNLFQARPGAGPRHFDFHPNGKLAFVVNELDSTVTSLSYDGRSGTLREIETLSTLSPGFQGANTCADIHVSPNGEFLYCSNRGSDSIAVFGIRADGKLSYVENTSTGGKKPRNFLIDPTGNHLLAANQDTGNIVVFQIDGRSGRLQRTPNEIEVPAPVCLKFVRASR